jgi:hypothetical protein
MHHGYVGIFSTVGDPWDVFVSPRTAVGYRSRGDWLAVTEDGANSQQGQQPIYFFVGVLTAPIAV